MKLVCDRCNRTYTDPESIASAIKHAGEWKKQVEADGDIPHGISPCPNLSCNGELILHPQ